MNATKYSDGTTEYEAFSTAYPKAKAVEKLRADMDILLKDMGQPPLEEGEGVVKTTKKAASGPQIGAHGAGWTLKVTRKED
jgi:hypothetical protein